MTRRLSTIALLALAVLGLASPAQAGTISAGACQMKHVRLVDANAYVVVAEVPSDQPGSGRFYPGDRMMCDVAVGKWRILARTEIDPSYEINRISGHYVGYSGSVAACEDCDDDSFVGVRNATTGHTVFMRYMHLTDSNDTRGYTIFDMTLKPNGSVAFTVDGNWRHAWKHSHLVVKHDQCGGTRVLDSSRSDVRLYSLRRTDSRIRWRHGESVRTAVLC